MEGEPKKGKKLFRAAPPRDLVERLVRASGLLGLNDVRWFSKGELAGPNSAALEECLIELEPYYLPCKATRFLHSGPMTPDKLVTVLRQVLRPHAYDLETQERSYHGAKQTLYKLQQPATASFQDLSGISLTVEFL